MKICSDVDGVILDYVQGFIDFTKKEKIAYKYDPHFYGVVRNYPNKNDIYKKFYSGNYLSNLNFYDSSLKVLNFLVKKHELHLVSALGQEHFQKRAKNLESLNYTSLQCVGDSLKEKIVIKEIKPDIMIEDRPKLIKAFHNAGISVIFPDWHLYTSGMERYAIPFSSWEEIPELLNIINKNLYNS